MEQLERYREWLDPHLLQDGTDLNKPLHDAAPRLFDLIMRAGSDEQGLQRHMWAWMFAWWVLVVGVLIYFEPRMEIGGCLIVPLAFILLIIGSLAVIVLSGALRGDLIVSLLEEPVMRVSARETRPGDTVDAHFSQVLRRTGTLRKGTLRLIQRESRLTVDSDGTDAVHNDTTLDQSELLPGDYMGGQGLEMHAAFDIPASSTPTMIGEKQHHRWFIVVDLDFAKMPHYQEMYEIIIRG